MIRVSMIDQIIHDLKKRYNCKGCKEAVLMAAKHEQQVDFLPEMYRKFMLACGDCFEILLGDACNCDRLEIGGYKRDLIDTLAEKSMRLPPDIFVFFSHGDYVWYFFRTNPQVDDPPIYCYYDQDPGIRLISPGFSHLVRLPKEYPISQMFRVFFYYDSEANTFYPVTNEIDAR